eukprot:6186964-Pleurochrysis_carterae.AAC.1
MPRPSRSTTWPLLSPRAPLTSNASTRLRRYRRATHSAARPRQRGASIRSTFASLRTADTSLHRCLAATPN